MFPLWDLKESSYFFIKMIVTLARCQTFVPNKMSEAFKTVKLYYFTIVT